MSSLSPAIIEQLKMILADQEEALIELREKRSELRDSLLDLDSKEIEILLGIEKTTEILRNYGEEV